MLPNQRPLLADRLSVIDATLEPGLTTLSWQSDEVDAFIAQASSAVADAFSICDSITSNLQKSFGQKQNSLASRMHAPQMRFIANYKKMLVTAGRRMM